jgi:hypothetical protein
VEEQMGRAVPGAADAAERNGETEQEAERTRVELWPQVPEERRTDPKREDGQGWVRE